MANNRMFLIHRPTGLAVALGKRMGFGWYTANADELGHLIQRLYETLERDYSYSGNQDDFALMMEDATNAPMAKDGWRYSEEGRDDGLIQLVLKGNV